ncbi:MAG TPA: glycosyltransferase family 87 protein [Gemmataceae bacterium]|jgi:hypothetical protein|nr:glycosyltransferase family 87 protein [Gemmataceae bacterium]
MSPDGHGLPGWARDHWVRWAATAWLVIVTAVCARAVMQPRVRSLYPTWAAAGGDWLARAPLYRTTWEQHLDQFRYSPLVAALFAPFHLLPEWLGGAVWRLLNAVALLGGFAWWLRAVSPRPLTARRWGALFLLIAPLSLSSLNNGQPNLLIAGLLLAALAGVMRERWALAAFCVAGATALKVYPLALGLLLAAVYPRRFAPRLAVALAALAAAPFALQQTGYVAEQYRLWYERLRDNDEARRSWPPHMAYRDLWLLLRAWHVPVTPRAYLLVQLVSAAGCGAVCVAGRLRGWGRPRLLTAVLTLAACWMMLCGPATESSTYVLLAPALAWAVLGAGGEAWPARVLPALAWGLLVVCVLAGLFPNTAQFHALGLQPLAALIFSAGYLATMPRALLATAAAPVAPAGAARAA